MSVQQPGGSASSVSISGSLPAGSNTIGNVGVNAPVDGSGNIKVNVAAGGGSGGTSSSYGAAFPATGTAAGFSDGTNMQAARVFDVDSGVGVQYVAGVNLRISASGGSIEAVGQQVMASSIPVVIASNQSAVPVSGTVTANQGTPQTAANGWPIRATDGTNLINVGDNANSAIRVNVVAGGGSGGTSSSFSAAFPATGTAVGASDGTNMKPLLVDASGFLKVNVAAGGGSGGTSSSFAAAFPATGTAAGFSDGTNMQAARVFDTDTGAGTQYVAGVNLRISASGGSIEAVGQKVMASSIPVVVASDQSGIPVSSLPALPAGTNVIGHVIVDTLPSLPAGTNVIGHVVVDSMPSNLTAPTQAHANIAASTTDGVLIAAVTGKILYIVGLIVVCGATATSITFNSKPAGAGTAISATFALAANGGFVWPATGAGTAIFSTNSGEGLTVTTGAGSTVGFQVLYSAV